MTNAWSGGTPVKVPAQDRLEIVELFARYAWGLDLADPDMLLSAFARDAHFDHLWQGRVQGHEAILKNMHELWYERQHWWYGRQHLFNHFIMEPVPEGIRVRCFFQIMQFNVEYGTNFVFGIGTRDDLCVKEDERWVFKTLHVNAWRGRDDVPWKGEVTIAGRPGEPRAARAPAGAPAAAKGTRP
jgi:hypothetical protein